MGRNCELDNMLKSGTGIKITGAIFVVLGVVLYVIFAEVSQEAGWVLLATMLLCALFFFIIGFSISANKRSTIDRLEKNSETEAALEDYNSESTVKLDRKGCAALGSKFIFVLNAGKIYNYNDILWVYISIRRSNNIPVAQSLTVCTADGKRCQMINEKMSNDGKVRLNSYIAIIKERNPECVVGYDRVNAKVYKNAVKKINEAS